jgi:hypothetical protein
MRSYHRTADTGCVKLVADEPLRGILHLFRPAMDNAGPLSVSGLLDSVYL